MILFYMYFQYLNNANLKSLEYPDLQGGLWVGRYSHLSSYSLFAKEVMYWIIDTQHMYKLYIFFLDF